MQSRIRVAVVGLGRMGTLHAQLAVESDCLSVTRLVDTQPGRATAVSKSLGVDGIPCSEDPVGSIDAAHCDAVIVSTPTSTHVPLIERAISQGIHVLCEKPLSLDPERDADLARQAESENVLLQIGFWRRFSPPWVAAHRAMRGGMIGRLLSYRGVLWDQGLPPPQFHDRAISGGLIVDCGVHDFDWLEWASGNRIVQVQALNLPLAHPEIQSTGDVDNAVVTLRMEDGSFGEVSLSRNARYGDDIRTEILGSGGAIFVDSFPSGGARLCTAEGVTPLSDACVDDPFVAGVRAQQVAFALAVRTGDHAAAPSGHESARALRVALAARQSADADGEPVSV